MAVGMNEMTRNGLVHSRHVVVVLLEGKTKQTFLRLHPSSYQSSVSTTSNVHSLVAPTSACVKTCTAVIARARDKPQIMASMAPAPARGQRGAYSLASVLNAIKTTFGSSSGPVLRLNTRYNIQKHVVGEKHWRS